MPQVRGGSVRMSGLSIGPPSGDAEIAELIRILNRTYLRSEEEGQAWLKRNGTDNLRVVRSNRRVAGSLLLIPSGQFFGGRSVPMTGVAAVAVDPERRSSGLAGALMRSALEELHSSGTALSALYPATQPVYRRAGWELAGTWNRYAVRCSDIDIRDRTAPLRRIEPAEAEPAVRPIYEKKARVTPGHLDRHADLWRQILSAEREEPHVYVVGDEGYTIFSQRRDGGWKYDLQCRDFVATTAAAARRLWALFADHRSFANRVVWTGGPSEPMAFVLREQQWELQRQWTWMMRLVDVRGALEGRGYAPGLEGQLHLDVRDDTLPWNHGRFVLDVSGGRGSVRKGGRGRLSIDIRGLAALYTGFLSAHALPSVGYAEGPEAELGKAAALFAGPAPWSADFF